MLCTGGGRGIVADAEEGKAHYGIEFADIAEVKNMDAVIIAVGHAEFMNFEMSDIDSMFAAGDNSGKVISTEVSLLLWLRFIHKIIAVKIPAAVFQNTFITNQTIALPVRIDQKFSVLPSLTLQLGR